MSAGGGAVPADLVEALAVGRARMLAEVAVAWASHRDAESVELLAAVQALAVPTRGPVLFVLRDLSVRWMDPTTAAALVARLRELTQPLAPQRSAVVVLGYDMSLELLGEEYLSALGLTWAS